MAEEEEEGEDNSQPFVSANHVIESVSRLGKQLFRRELLRRVMFLSSNYLFGAHSIQRALLALESG